MKLLCAFEGAAGDQESEGDLTDATNRKREVNLAAISENNAFLYVLGNLTRIKGIFEI